MPAHEPTCKPLSYAEPLREVLHLAAHRTLTSIPINTPNGIQDSVVLLDIPFKPESDLWCQIAHEPLEPLPDSPEGLKAKLTSCEKERAEWEARCGRAGRELLALVSAANALRRHCSASDERFSKLRDAATAYKKARTHFVELCADDTDEGYEQESAARREMMQTEKALFALLDSLGT